MANRRPLFRQRQERPASRKGLWLCLFLAGAVMLVPIGGGFVKLAKTKARDLVLSTGLFDFDGCVVTPDQAIACGSDAIGTPLPAALHAMAEQKVQAAEEQRLRREAEEATRKLVAEVDRLNAALTRSQLAARAEGFLPPVVTTVTRTGSAAGEAPVTVPPETSEPPSDVEPVIYEPSAEE